MSVELVLAADRDGSGTLSFDEVCLAMQHRLQSPDDLQQERYFVAISLAEAEGLRALLHARRGRSEPLFDECSASIALRYGTLDFEASLGFQAGAGVR